MNITKASISDVYEDFFKIVSLNKDYFYVNIYDNISGRFMYNAHYRITIDTTEELEFPNNPFSLTFSFSFDFDFDILNAEYDKLFKNPFLKVKRSKISKRSDIFKSFLKEEWIEVVKNLESFNHKSNRYHDIAILLARKQSNQNSN
jgi:hypothetical protein